jgi:hypothetical protein
MRACSPRQRILYLSAHGSRPDCPTLVIMVVTYVAREAALIEREHLAAPMLSCALIVPRGALVRGPEP